MNTPPFENNVQQISGPRKFVTCDIIFVQSKIMFLDCQTSIFPLWFTLPLSPTVLFLLIFVLPTNKYLKWLLYLKRIINPEDQIVEVYGSPTDEKRKPGPNENPVSLPSPCHLSCHSAVWQVVDGNARDKMGNSVIYEDHGNAWSDILDKEAEDGIGNMVTNIWIPILNKSKFKICHYISVLCTSMQ